MSVTERAALPPLASIEDLELLSGESVSEEDRPRVERLLAMASAAVRAYTHQTITYVPDDEVVIPSSGTTLIVLAERPVSGIAHVEIERMLDWWWAVEGDPITRGGWMHDGTARFTWDAFGRLRRLDGWTWGLRYDPVVVTYSHGYDPIPDDIVGLVASKVSYEINTSASRPSGLKSVRLGDLTETYVDTSAGELGALDADEKALLTRFRASSDSLSMGTQ